MIKLAASAIAVVFTVAAFAAWRDAHRQQAALQTELKTTQQALAEATARQASRDAAVNSLLAQIKQQKARIQSPAQAVAALPQVLPLPQAISLDSPKAPSSLGAPPARPERGRRVVFKGGSSLTGSPNPSTARSDAPDSPKPATLPAADLKPLYDFAVDCKACQAQLAAAQADLKDEQAKEQALSRERDDALRAAKGGSVLRRITRATKWFLIGAAAGAIATKAAHL